jgi:signal transduction histidine kinase
VLRSSAADSHHGGLENLTARLETLGGRLTVTSCDGQFDLLAEVPNRQPDQ